MRAPVAMAVLATALILTTGPAALAQAPSADAPDSASQAEAREYQQAVSRMEGRGVPRDPARAFETMSRLAEDGNAQAMHSLGVWTLQGRGAPADTAGAIALFRRSSRAGYPVATFALGEITYGGLFGVARDSLVGVELIRRAADARSADAILWIAFAHYNGDRLPKDWPQARAEFKRAMEVGDVRGMAAYGEMLLDGQGGPAGAEGLRHLRAAAAGGLGTAALTLAMIYRDGIRLVAADRDEARRWFARARELGAPGVDAEEEKLR